MEIKLHNMQDLFNATKNTCHIGMGVELRSRKVLTPLETKKKRITEEPPLIFIEEEPRPEEEIPDDSVEQQLEDKT